MASDLPQPSESKPGDWWDVLTRTSGLAVWELDALSGRFTASQGIDVVLGVEAPATLDAMVASVHPEDAVRCREAFASGADGSATRFRRNRPDGSLAHLLCCSTCLSRDGQGRPLRLRGTLRDVSDEVLHRERITAIAAVVGRAHGADCLPSIARCLATRTGADTCLVMRFNGANCHCVAGWMQGTVPADLGWSIPGSPCEPLRAGEPVLVPDRLEAAFPQWSPPAGLRAKACVAVPLFDSEARPIGGLLLFAAQALGTEAEGARDLLAIFSPRAESELARQDIAADLDRAEQRLHQNEKMDALGRLAGGIAHDFNNMLAGIMGAAELLDARLGLDSPHHRLVRTIIHSAERAADLTRKLLSFSRKAPVQRRQLDLRSPVEEALAILERSIDRNIAVRRDFGASPTVVAGDAGLLQAMALNLCINACEAMPRGGTLTVSLTTPSSETGDDMWGLPSGRYVQLSVADTGVGMDEETASRIFEPFFSTKALGAGTGLGLAAAYGTIHEHGGAVRVRTAPGRGTTMLVRLPLLASLVHEHHNRPEGPQRGTGRVLLVDDEEVVRQATGELLASLGWQVVHARDGEEGVRRFAENPGAYALAVVDSIMPRMDGLACFRGMRELRPELPVVFCSGYTRDRTRTELPGEAHVAFVQKPFRIAELVQAIQQVRGS